MGILATYRAAGIWCARGNNFPARGGSSCPESALRSQGHPGRWLLALVEPSTCAPVIYCLCTHLLPLIKAPIPLGSSVAFCWLPTVCPPPSCLSSESQGLLQDGGAMSSLGIFARGDQGRQQKTEGDAWATLVSHPSSFHPNPDVRPDSDEGIQPG